MPRMLARLDPLKPDLRIELALLALLAGFWGSSYLLLKIALTSFPPVTLTGIRTGVAALFLFGIMRLQGQHLPRDATSWRALGIQSLLNSSVAWLLLAWGQQFVPSGTAGVLNSTSPIFVVLITAMLSRQRGVKGTTWFQNLGVALGFLGVVLIVGADALSGLGQQSLAQLAVLLSAVLYAFAALNGKHLAHLSPLATATGTLLCAAVCVLPLSFLVEQPWAVRPSLNAVLAVLALTIFCTGVALILYFRLVNTLGAVGVASQSYLRAGFSVLLGAWALGEQPAMSVLIGLAATVLGVALINWPRHSKAI